MRIPRIRIDPDCADWSERALVAEARLKAMAEARQRDRQRLQRAARKVIGHWRDLYHFLDEHSHWQVKALDYERQKRDEAEAKGRRDRQRLRRVLAIGREYASIILNLRVRLFDARHWAAAWKAAATKWYITRPLRAAQKEIIEDLTAERDELRRKVVQLLEVHGEAHESGDNCISCGNPATADDWPYCHVCLVEHQLECALDGNTDLVKLCDKLRGRLERAVRLLDERCGTVVENGALDPNSGECIDVWKPCALAVGLAAVLREEAPDGKD